MVVFVHEVEEESVFVLLFVDRREGALVEAPHRVLHDALLLAVAALLPEVYIPKKCGGLGLVVLQGLDVVLGSKSSQRIYMLEQDVLCVEGHFEG